MLEKFLATVVCFVAGPNNTSAAPETIAKLARKENNFLDTSAFFAQIGEAEHRKCFVCTIFILMLHYACFFDVCN